ncbi:MAG TPA: SRPBCC family protein, partial [Gemmatimonadales bacterium]|nr:SRPBCC family protein [Gemmatimonadales bacterium]
MQGQGKLLTGALVGAGAMYLLDPDWGATRRSFLWDRGTHLRHQLEGNGLQSSQGVELGTESEAEDTRPNWRPATRLVVGALGSLLALQGSRTRGLQGQMLSLFGVGLVTRAAVNLPTRRLITRVRGARPITVEKTLLVGAPANRVWEIWSNFEGFPRFMAHLREVRKIEEGRSHWVAIGPAGVPAEWEAIVTDWVPGQFLGWRSVENSPIE